MHKAEKEAMIGEDVEDLNTVLTAAAAEGHALFWNEVKSVGLLSQVLSDLDVGHVVDLSPASGAMAAAAAMNHITYDGFCFNDLHKRWLEGVMDRTMLKVLTDTEVKNNDKGFSEEIKKFFATSIADAEKLIAFADSEEKVPAKKTDTDEGSDAD